MASKNIPAAASIGQRFGRVVVLGICGKDTHGRAIALCRCDCGLTPVIDLYKLRIGHTRSCGCLRQELNTTHGGSYSVTYSSWRMMKKRCNDPNYPKYDSWGGRGIRVCQRWCEFKEFLEDMGHRPSGTSLDRINNDGDYEPGNCRWATRKEQNSNTRRNVLLTFNGKTQNLTEWARELNVRYLVLWGRLKSGWSTEKTLSTPVATRTRKRL